MDQQDVSHLLEQSSLFMRRETQQFNSRLQPRHQSKKTISHGRMCPQGHTASRHYERTDQAIDGMEYL